eukprot:171277-Prymnesium_polylepis.1
MSVPSEGSLARGCVCSTRTLARGCVCSTRTLARGKAMHGRPAEHPPQSICTVSRPTYQSHLACWECAPTHSPAPLRVSRHRGSGGAPHASVLRISSHASARPLTGGRIGHHDHADHDTPCSAPRSSCNASRRAA